MPKTKISEFSATPANNTVESAVKTTPTGVTGQSTIDTITRAQRNILSFIVDSVGDVMVCLINYCVLQDINLVQCMEIAYDQIKNRKGILLPNGVFQKEN